jgi:hypothetical protein
MALPSSGVISLSDVNVELGLSSTAQISLNDSAVRTLFGVASGAINMEDGYGKANEFGFTIASNTTNANLRSLAVSAGWDESTSLIATLDSGIYISSDATGTPALTIDGSFPSGVKFVNNGTVVGDGGNGGAGGYAQNSPPGAVGGGGGTAISISVAVSIENNGVIAGGGGGGGGGGGSIYGAGKGYGYASGGGGGGGQSGLTNSSGGGGNQTGTAGTISAAGGGGIGGGELQYGGTGGTGGGWGANGANGAPGKESAGAGGGGGAGGAATSGQSYVTWLATGTRYGTIG